MPALHALRPFLRAALGAMLALAAWWVAFPRASMPPIIPLGDQFVYSTTDPAALVLLEPVLHAPWLGEVSPWGRLAAALTAAIGATGVAIFAGASVLATLFVVAALMVDASFGAALSHASGLAVAVGLVWLAAGAAFDEHQRVSPARPWFNPLAAIVLWAGAVWWHWIALVTWPIVFAALRRTPQRPVRGAWTLASLAAGLATFLAHFDSMARAAMTHAFSPATTLTTWDALGVAFDSRPWMPAGSYVAADLTTGVSYLAVGLAMVALVFGDLERWWRRAVTLSGLLIVAVIAAWPEWQAEVLGFAAWSLTPLAAVGLTWVSRQAAREHLVRVATVAIGAVLVGETVAMGARPLSNQGARGFRDALVHALERDVRQPVVIVAEDTRIDAAITAWAVGREGRRRVVQDPRAVSAALREGAAALAGPVARQHLELAGFTFRRRFTLVNPALFVMSVTDRALRCVPVRGDRWSLLPGVEYTGRLGVELPAAIAGEMQIIVGDTLPPRIRVESADGQDVPVVSESLLTGPGVSAPPPDYWLDGGLPDDGPHRIRQLHLPTHPARPSLLAVHLGRRAPRVMARLAGVDNAARGRICAAPLGREPLFADGDGATERIPLDDAHVFGTGWYGLERQGPSMLRWAGVDAVVLLPSAGAIDVEVTLEAEAAVDAADGGDVRQAGEVTRTADHADAAQESADRGGLPDDGTTVKVTLRVNGIDVGTRRIGPGERRSTWGVPAGVWLEGTNELWWHTTRAVRPVNAGGQDTRSLALRVKGIEIGR